MPLFKSLRFSWERGRGRAGPAGATPAVRDPPPATGSVQPNPATENAPSVPDVTAPPEAPILAESEASSNVGIRPFPPRPNELPQVSRPDVQQVDIIAVHGLGGHWLRTWQAPDGAVWLRDRLPQLLAEHNIQARTLSYGYDANFVFTNTVNDISIVARDLLNQVDSTRTTEAQKKAPIIFVAHSLGGVVVKEAFNKAWTEQVHFRNIVDKAAGCIFLGVPHRGADLAHWARNGASIMRALTGRGNDRLAGAISRSSDEWKKIGWDFVFRTANIHIATLFETTSTNGVKVVDQESARLGLPGERTEGLPSSDHRNICRFGDDASESARFLVLGNLAIWVIKSASERVFVSPIEAIEQLAADRDLMDRLALSHPEHRQRVTHALISIAGPLHTENTALRYPHLFGQIERRLSSALLDDGLANSTNYIPEQYTVDTLVPRFMDAHPVIRQTDTAGRAVFTCQTWWLRNPRQWMRIRLAVLGARLYNPSYRQDTELLVLLTTLSRGGVPLLNIFLDHYLADRDPADGDATIKVYARSERGAIDVLGLDFESKNFTVECKTQYNNDRHFVKSTADILAMGCPTLREADIAVETRLTGLACKVRVGGRVCAQKHMPTDLLYPMNLPQEIEAFIRLQGSARVAEFVGVVLHSSRGIIKSFLHSWEPNILSDLLHNSVKTARPIPWGVIEKWAWQIVEAVSFAHSKGVILSNLNLRYFGVDDVGDIRLIHIRKKRTFCSTGWLPPEHRLGYISQATKESDVFQLGVLLWLLTDYSVTIPPRNKAGLRRFMYWERRAHQNIPLHLRIGGILVGLPPCGPGVPLYYQAVIKMCRHEAPSRRETASNLLTHFPGRSGPDAPSPRRIALYHRLVYDGTGEGSPWIYPPPVDKLEDLNIDNTHPFPSTYDVGEFLSNLGVRKSRRHWSASFDASESSLSGSEDSDDYDDNDR